MLIIEIWLVSKKVRKKILKHPQVHDPELSTFVLIFPCPSAMNVCAYLCLFPSNFHHAVSTILQAHFYFFIFNEFCVIKYLSATHFYDCIVFSHMRVNHDGRGFILLLSLYSINNTLRGKVRSMLLVSSVFR